MNHDELKKIVGDTGGYGESREMTLRQMVSEFYSRKMRCIMVWTWIWGFLFFALALAATVLFFRSEDTKELILYAALFLSGIIGISYMKAWPLWMYLLKTTKRLDIQLAELTELQRKGRS
jgi:hypothetical protein